VINILIADDQPLQRAGFRMVLGSQADIEIVGEAGDGAQALAQVRRTRTDVVLMDLRMPRVNGLVASQRITTDARVLELGPAPRIILITALELDEHVPGAADAGVYAMVYKDVEPERLLSIVRAAAANP
jgi:DNA-binding NarL/FixJ family response regulator